MLALARPRLCTRLAVRRVLQATSARRTLSSRPAFQLKPEEEPDTPPLQLPEHAVISTFDLFSIGGEHARDSCALHVSYQPSRYGSLAATGKGHHTPQAILLGLEGPSHHSKIYPVSALALTPVSPRKGSDPETIDTGTIPIRYQSILANKSLLLGGKHRITYNIERDMVWHWDRVLKTHPNGMRFSVFGDDGELLATNEYFSVGGGFVVNEKTKGVWIPFWAVALLGFDIWTVDENMFYKSIDKRAVHESRLHQSHSLADPSYGTPPISPNGTDDGTANGEQSDEHPPYPFSSGDTLLALTKKHNMTIAQIVHDNEIMKIWSVMDECIHTGVTSTETTLPGRLGLRRRAPNLYRRLMRGLYPGIVGQSFPQITSGTQATAAISSPLDHKDDFHADSNNNDASARATTRLRTSAHVPRIVGSFDHAVLPMAPRKTDIPAMDFLSCYAIAVNEVNASGGRIVTSPTNGAAGVIPAVLKYIIEFMSDAPEKSIQTFLLTASAVGMLFKRGSTISAAEGGCQAEVGVACSMASAGFAACMGGMCGVPIFQTVLQAAEIGIEHNLGLTCDPIDGLVQVPCIERNSLGAVKAVTAAQLSMASDGVYSVTLDEAIEAMRLTAQDMSVKYKETSLSLRSALLAEFVFTDAIVGLLEDCEDTLVGSGLVRTLVA
ncbi:hypothetical protein H0H92_006923 [Tricholoma furcatifolium]|nr:hypothetical protein H0H92_006923 [Tricholoma furcatifolium]